MLEARGALPLDPPPSPAPRLLLVEPDPRAATRISSMLGETWGHDVIVAHVERMAGAAQELVEHKPDCVLVHIASACGDGDRSAGDRLRVLHEIRTAVPDMALVALFDEEAGSQALAAVRAGAQECLVVSELAPSRLRQAVACAIERKLCEEHLAHQALHDSLTSLPNRALFLDRLGVALDRSRRSETAIAVLFLDVDNFKHVNDSFGHAAGDRLLTELARRFQKLLRPMDTVARFGGDEFTFLFEELANEREILVIADRISSAASRPVALEAGHAAITVSIGIAMVADPSAPPETVIREADAAMYRAKERGRSRCELFGEATRQRATHRLELEEALRHALDRSELRILYQPRFSLTEPATVLGFEALARWEHPERGLLAPREFIPLAEETGLIEPIGQYVLEQVIARLCEWHGRRPGVSVSVNLSLRQLEDPALRSRLARSIEATPIDPAALCVEIAESAITHNRTVRRTAQGLKELGVRIAIDDFGTACSSLSGLKHLPVDILKIHESLLGRLGSDPQEAAVVRATVELGHALEAEVVAEGVERAEQAAELRALGCDGAQGFLFGAPLPREQAAELLAHARRTS